MKCESSILYVWMLVCILIFPTYQLHAEEQLAESMPLTKAKFRWTYENIKLPANETVGFSGWSSLYDVNDWLSVGGATYGAMAGQRGGFITIGGEAEVRKKLSRAIEMNSGIFVGAGGGRGGYFLSGGGLMLRYHLGMNYQSEFLGKFGAGISFLDFPNGTIHSSQPYVSYELPFKTLIISGWQEYNGQLQDSSQGRYRQAEQEFAPIFRSYLVPTGVWTDSGAVQQRNVRLMGVEWNHYLDDAFFLHVETLGAMGGKSRGYMQSLLGGGYRRMLLDGTYLKLTASAGMAGGGNVATGGGFLGHTDISLQQQLDSNLSAEISAGYIKAPHGGFKAYTLTGKLGYHFYTPEVSSDMESLSLSDVIGFQPSHLRVRITHQKYMKASPNWRGHHNNLNVGNLGVQLDAFLTDDFFLSGQVLAAYSGQAGAYMVGLVGVGVHEELFETPVFFDAAGLVGASGGGGLSTGAGLVWQLNAGIGYQLNEKYSLITQYGYMAAATKGNFKAKVLTFSLGYNFTLLTKD